MEQSNWNLSVLDSRYAKKVDSLREYGTEESLILERIKTELHYFKFLSNILSFDFNESNFTRLEKDIFENKNSTIDFVREIEKETNHDIKAVEYFLIGRFKEFGVSHSNFIHFGLTSADINSISYISLFKSAILSVYIPKLNLVYKTLLDFSHTYEKTFMVTKTHGQNATPSSLGYQIQVFNERIYNQIKQLKKKKYNCKIGGATGGLNSHYLIFPDVNWNKELSIWCTTVLGLTRNTFTSQVDHNEIYAEILSFVSRIAVILLDLVRDIWMYISMGYIKQKVVKTEVGSSTMPHKINPIDFENAEGNLKLCISLCNFFSDQLPVSRLQRDLSNSTLFRNIFQPLAYSLISFDSIVKGFSKLEPDVELINSVLEDSWELLAEPIVCQLKVWGIEDSYSKLKDLTRSNEKITREKLHSWIENSDFLTNEQKEKLKQFKPENYIPFQI